MKKKIAILGSTGSIGKTLINIIKNDKKNFEIILLTANKNYSEFENFESIENKLKRKFGFSFFEKDINKIDVIVEDVILNFKSKIPHLDNFKNKYFFNFGKTIEEFEKIWENKINKN